MISVIITMTLIWLLLCFASVVTLKQYAQKNLELTGATMSHSLEASLVFNDSLAANETLAALCKQGQFAAAETVSISGPKGRIDNVRVLGPARGKTQVEIFLADAYKLDIEPVIRISGDVEGTPGATVVGPGGSVSLPFGVIVAQRHLHLSAEQAAFLNLNNGDLVSIKKEGVRALIFEKVPVRCGAGHQMELHLDLEEANAGGIKNGELLEIVAIERKQ